MPITLDQAKSLYSGQVVYHSINKNKDGTKQKWKINGQVKTWKRNPLKVKIPVKYGLYTYDYITENDLHLIDIED